MTESFINKVDFRAPQHLFVYGSLKEGFSNNYLLANRGTSIRCGDFFTKGKFFEMYHLGGFPGVIQSAKDSHRIKGDLYLVTPEVLSRIDSLERHPSWFTRVRVLLDDGTWAFTYVLKQHSVEGRDKVEVTTDVDSGDSYYEWTKNVSFK